MDAVRVQVLRACGTNAVSGTSVIAAVTPERETTKLFAHPPDAPVIRASLPRISLSIGML
jgi:hypothetical protein